jgi:hypothetical protein
MRGAVSSNVNTPINRGSSIPGWALGHNTTGGSLMGIHAEELPNGEVQFTINEACDDLAGLKNNRRFRLQPSDTGGLRGRC